VQLIEPTYDQVIEFCGRDPIERVFLEDVARRDLGRFVATEGAEGTLESLCHVGANIVPSGQHCELFAKASAVSQSRMIIGETGAVTALWEAARKKLPAPRADRPGQPVYVLDTPPAPGRTGLRPATPRDLDRLVPACADAHELELGIDPVARDEEGFRWRTSAQIDEGRSWLWTEGMTILFKAEASAWTPRAVQLQQVWVDPEARGRGYAQRGLRDLCRLLLARVPAVCLFVRSDNAVAIHVYERVGMRHTISYRSLIF
jgi:uncharacterized protein